MFYQKIFWRNLTERFMTTRGIIISHSGFNNSDYAFYVFLFPEYGFVFALKMTIKGFHGRIASGTVQRIRYTRSGLNANFSQPFMAGIDCILIMMNHDFLRNDAKAAQIAISPFPGRRGKRSIFGAAECPAKCVFADMVNDRHQICLLISAVKRQLGNIRIKQIQRANLLQSWYQIYPATQRCQCFPDTARRRTTDGTQKWQIPRFLQVLHHFFINRPAAFAQLSPPV